MQSMALAMLVMLLSVPLHLLALRGHSGQGMAWIVGVAWLSAALTLGTLWTARPVWIASLRALRGGRLDETALVSLCALAALFAGVPALSPGAHAAPMYFDVAAMAMAWLVGGQAQRSDSCRRYVERLEQLTPLGFVQNAPPTAPKDDTHDAVWLALVLGGTALAGSVIAANQADSAMQVFQVGLATLALGCPSTLGIAVQSAAAAGAKRAAAAGWLVPSPAVLLQPVADPRAAIALGSANTQDFVRIAHATRVAVRCNRFWAVGVNLALLPLAVRGPVDPLLPAMLMVLARALIAVTNHRLLTRGSP